MHLRQKPDRTHCTHILSGRRAQPDCRSSTPPSMKCVQLPQRTLPVSILFHIFGLCSHRNIYGPLDGNSVPDINPASNSTSALLYLHEDNYSNTRFQMRFQGLIPHISSVIRDWCCRRLSIDNNQSIAFSSGEANCEVLMLSGTWHWCSRAPTRFIHALKVGFGRQ